MEKKRKKKWKKKEKKWKKNQVEKGCKSPNRNQRMVFCYQNRSDIL